MSRQTFHRALRLVALTVLWHSTVASGGCEGGGGGLSCPDTMYYDATTRGCAPMAREGEACGARPCYMGFCGEDAICHAYAQQGEACERTQCVSGTLCDFDHTCATYGDIQPGGECYGHDACAEGAVCHPETGSCGPRRGDGEPCAWDDGLCQDGLRCLDDGRGAAVCRAPAQEGGACTFDGACVIDLLCHPTEFVCYRPRRELEACDEHARCAGDLACISTVGAAGICTAPRTAGEACESTGDCAPGLECLSNADESTACRAARALGEACDPTLADDCGGNLLCVPEGFEGARTCVYQLPLGAPCADRSECLPGLTCRFARLWEGACAAPGEPGETCALDLDCRAGLRCVAAEDDGPRVCR